MNEALQPFIEALRRQRKRKGLSQRTLSAKIAVPQSHLSRIEAGNVDLRSSAMIELARALDLEPVLVPRALLPAVHALLRQAEGESTDSGPAYRLEEENDG